MKKFVFSFKKLGKSVKKSIFSGFVGLLNTYQTKKLTMGIFTRKKKEVQPEERAINIGGLSFNSITSYSNDQAMRLGAVYCATNQISNSVAMLPIYIYRIENGKKIRVNHNLYNVLNMSPDRKYTSFMFMKQMIESVLLKGNAYAYIVRDENLNVVSLQYIDSDYVTPVLQPDGGVKYIVNGLKEAVDSINMIHLYLHLDQTFRGISTIKYASQALETASDAEQHAANFFKSGGNLSGIIKASSILTNDQKKQIQDSWVSSFNGNRNKVSVAILPQGLEYQPISVNPEDAELLETRKYDVINIARFFNISPIKLFDLSDVSYNSMEAAQIAYLNDTILPWTKLIEAEFNRKLFKPSQMGKLVVSMDFTVLLASNKESEANYYKSMLVNGIMSLNEVRDRLGLEPMVDELGDKHWMQLAMATIDNIATGANIKGASVDNQAKDNNPKNTDE